MNARDVTDDGSVYVVTALAKSTDSIGWRSRIVGARSEEEAIGKALRLFEAREPEKDFCAAGVIAISTESISSAGAGGFVVLSRAEVDAIRDKALEEAAEIAQYIPTPADVQDHALRLGYISASQAIATAIRAMKSGGGDATMA